MPRIIWILGLGKGNKSMKTRMDDTVDNYHGTLVADPYRWLEKQGDPEVARWIEAQNKLTQEFLQGTSGGEGFKQRLTELWNYPRYSLPVQVGTWIFYQKNSGLQNQPLLYRQDGLKGKPQLILDPNLWSADGTIAISNFSVDQSARYLAYTVSAKGSDRQTIRIRDLEAGKDLPEIIHWCKFTNISWVDDQGFYYSRFPEPGSVPVEDESNFSQVYWHQLGTLQADDQLIYEDQNNKELGFNAQVTADQEYLLIRSAVGTDSRNGIYYKKLATDDAFSVLLEPGKSEFTFLGNEGAIFYFLTDLAAARGRIVAVNLENPAQEQWQEIVAEQTRVISNVRLINGKLIIAFLEHAHAVVEVYSLTGQLSTVIPLPGLGSIEGLSGKQGQKGLFIAFTSFLVPTLNLYYDLQTKQLTNFGEQKLAFDPELYETDQVFYPSKDGTQVSLFLVHKKGIKKDGNNPTLLYGYGGFNISITPAFNASRILWLEQGGIYAVANLRGGSEYGEAWHQAGMGENKQNVFDDFIAAAEWLIKENYTSAQKLAIEGRSNGGLLVAACLVQRPDLFGAVICGVPVTDMLRYHKFTVGRYWVPEYGNAEASATDFQVLHAYSPVHNVQKASYPSTLVVTADGDDRVVPAHAYKFTATLQAAQQGDQPVLIRVDTKSGHGHGKPISKIIDEHADVYTFLLQILQR